MTNPQDYINRYGWCYKTKDWVQEPKDVLSFDWTSYISCNTKK